MYTAFIHTYNSVTERVTFITLSVLDVLFIKHFSAYAAKDMYVCAVLCAYTCAPYHVLCKCT